MQKIVKQTSVSSLDDDTARSINFWILEFGISLSTDQPDNAPNKIPTTYIHPQKNSRYCLIRYWPCSPMHRRRHRHEVGGDARSGKAFQDCFFSRECDGGGDDDDGDGDGSDGGGGL